MRNPVRPDNLEFIKNDISSHVSLTLDERDVQLVTKLVTPFVIPNSLYSQDLTTAAQQAEREAVQPVVQSYKTGETIVAGGDIISPAQMEALQKFGLIQAEQPVETYLGVAALTLLLAIFTALYFYRRPQIELLSDSRSLIVFAFIFLVFLVTTRLVVPNRTIVPYAYPLPAIGLLLLRSAELAWAGRVCLRAGWLLRARGALTVRLFRATLLLSAPGCCSHLCERRFRLRPTFVFSRALNPRVLLSTDRITSGCT